MIGVTFHDLYRVLEPTLMPLIVDQADRFHRALGIDKADAIQEARMALVLALPNYDYDRSRGGIKAFARVTIKRALLTLLYQATAQMRAPYLVVMDTDGTERLVRCPVDSLDALETYQEPGDDDASNPEDRCINAEVDDRIKTLRLRLLMSLSGRERDVFECQAIPSETFMVFLRNHGIDDPTIDAIGSFLHLTKNEIDWSLHKIKRVFTVVLEGSEFSDLIEGAVRDGKWPMIHKSDVCSDIEFIQNIIQERGLDPRPTRPSDVTSNGQAHRSIENYEWGSIVHLKLDDTRQATLVLEGRFNYRTGEVIGIGGHWKQVSDYITWYSELGKLLSTKRRNNGTQ
jgi:hypothetical protein